jgi:hypothetical protein
MNKLEYLKYLLGPLVTDMQIPIGVRRPTDVAGSISLRRGTYVWQVNPEFHNSVSYRAKLNHAASGVAGAFKFVAFDDKRTPGKPDMRQESPLMSKNAGQTSEWIFNNYVETVFVGLEIPNDNTQILLSTSPPGGFRGLNPFWLKGPVATSGSQLQPGAAGDLQVVFQPPDRDLGERYPALQLAPTSTFPSDLLRFYHVDFEHTNTHRLPLERFCADLLQHYLDNYPGGLINYDRRPQWMQAHPNGTEGEYLAYLLQRLVQQPLNFPDSATLRERLSRRWRTNFVAPQAFEASSTDFAIEMLQRDLAGRNSHFLTAQEWENGNLRRAHPENFVALQEPLQRATTADTASLTALRERIAELRPLLPQQHSVQLILQVLDRAFELDLLLDRVRSALARHELGIADAALQQAENHAKFLFHHNYSLNSRLTTSQWAQNLMAEDAGVVFNPPLRSQLASAVRLLAGRTRGNSLINITSMLHPGVAIASDPQPAADYARRMSRTAAQLDRLARDVRFVPDAANLAKVFDELLEKNGNYTQLSSTNKDTLQTTVAGLWELMAHYVHLQMPLLYAEMHRVAGRHDAARRYFEVVLDDDDAGPAAMVRYPFLNALEVPAVALRSARNAREHGELLLRSMESEPRVFAEDEFQRARRLLTLAVDQNNPAAKMEIAGCDVGIHKIRHRLNIFGYSEDYVPLFRYQSMVALASDLAQQAIDAGRQLIAFWQQAEQAQRAELETSHAVALNAAMVEVEQLRVSEAHTMVTIAGLQVQQTAQQITDLNAKINELSDPVFFWAAVGTGVQSGIGLFGGGAAVAGPIGALIGVAVGGGAGAAAGSGAGPPGAAVGGTVGGAIGALAGGALVLAGAGYLAYAQGAAQWKAHESNLNDQRRSKALLEQFGTAIAARQLEAAQVQELIAVKMAEIARVRLAQTQEIAALLREQVFNAERYYQLVAQMRDVYRTLLFHAMRAAFVAEQALEFELNERVNVIGYEYDQPGEQFLLGAERLRSDIATLRTQRLERYSAKRQPACISISLAEEFPLSLFEMRTAGQTTIRTDLSLLERLYPGAYQARISRVELAFFALTPQIGLHGTVESSGLSFVKNDRGVSVALIVPPETMLISRYQYRDGAFYFALPEEQLHPFEGFGMATDFTIELPAIANNFERATIADLHLIVHFTTLYSDELEAKVIAARPATGSAMRSFSIHEAFSDAFFDLVNGGSCEFSLGQQHFPVTHRNPKIRRIMLLTMLKSGTAAQTVKWRIAYVDSAGANRQFDISATPSNPTVDLSAGGPSFAGMSAFGKWGLKGSLDSASGAAIPLEANLLDAVLFVEYEFGW